VIASQLGPIMTGTIRMKFTVVAIIVELSELDASGKNKPASHPLVTQVYYYRLSGFGLVKTLQAPG